MELNKGLLTLTPVEGKLTRDTEVMGKMSPYITIVFKKHKLKSKIHDYGGKKPVWGDEFVLDVESPTDEMVLRVWDQDLTSSDAVGFTKVKMSSLMINCGVEDWFTIMYDNKPAGEVKLKSHFEPEGGNAYANMQEKLAEQSERLQKEADEAKAAAAQMAQQ